MSADADYDHLMVRLRTVVTPQMPKVVNPTLNLAQFVTPTLMDLAVTDATLEILKAMTLRPEKAVMTHSAKAAMLPRSMILRGAMTQGWCHGVSA